MGNSNEEISIILCDIKIHYLLGMINASFTWYKNTLFTWNKKYIIHLI